MEVLENKKTYEGRLRKEDWVVLPVDILTARILVERLHYSKGGSNTGVYTHGLFRKGKEFLATDCLGVCWWLPPTKAAAVNTYPEGQWQKVLSLHRLVVAEKYEVNGKIEKMPKNACSFMLSRSMKMIDNTKWECLVTYADTWQGHTGSIYKATNWEYVSLTSPSPVLVNRAGKMMGRKRGGINLSKESLLNRQFEDKGSFPKHKFRKIIARHQ